MGDKTGAPRVGFVGVGEVGSSYARALLAGGLPPDLVRMLHLDDHPGADPSRAVAVAAGLGVALTSSPEEFTPGLDLVISAVTPQGALGTGRRIAHRMDPAQTYLDLNSTSPETKRTLADLFPAGSAQVVDGAIMGAPADSGIVSFSVSGERAQDVVDMLTPYGAQVDVAGGRVGDVAAIKMARSVVMKGLAMLLLESLGAARRAGVEGPVAAALDVTVHGREFSALVTRLVCGSLRHAGRRVHEMEEVSRYLSTLGCPAAMTRATTERLSWLASLGTETPWADVDLATVDAALDAVAGRASSPIDGDDVDVELVAGAIDLHVHYGPDPVTPRRYDIDEGARRAAEAGLGGFVVKSHSYDTTALAKVVSARHPELTVAGGITLDPPVGGLNPPAVEVAARLGARFVWLPTQGRLSVMDEHDPSALAAGLIDIVEIVRDYDLVLASGHIPAAEIRVLVPYLRRAGVRKFLITHAMNRRVGPGLSVAELRELVEQGVYVEHCYTTTLPPNPVPIHRIAEAIGETGPAQVVLSTDLGKQEGANPIAGFATFVRQLSAAGVPRRSIELMTRDNPRRLLATT